MIMNRLAALKKSPFPFYGAVFCLAWLGGACGGSGSEEPNPTEMLGEIEQEIGQPAFTEAEFWQFNNGSMPWLNSAELSHDWDQVVPIKFATKPYPSLLFYNRHTGTAELRDTSGNGALGPVFKTWSGWRHTWDNITTVNSASQVRLVFYDQSAGDLATYWLNADGSWGGGVTSNVGRFDITTAGRFYSSERNGVAGYSRTSGTINFWSINISTGSITYQTPITTTRMYDYMVAGDFMGSTTRDDLVLLDRDEGDLLSVRMDAPPSQQTTFDWTSPFVHGVLVAGQFNAATGFDDLLFYKQEEGRGEFYYSNGTTTPFSHAADSIKTTWRPSWARISRGKFRVCGGSCTDDILFYDNKYEIRIRPVVIPSDPAIDYPGIVAAMLTQLNLTYRQAGLFFSASPITYTGDPNLLPVCAEGPAANYADSWAIANYPAELVVFMRPGQKSCSGPLSEWANVNGTNWTSAHEVGHFFGLPHPWSIPASVNLQVNWDNYCSPSAPSPNPAFCTEAWAASLTGSAASAPDILDTDDEASGGVGYWLDIWDTPATPGYFYWAVAGMNGCDIRQDIRVDPPAPAADFWVNPDRFNIMDYHSPNYGNFDCGSGPPDSYHLSPMQARMVREDLINLWGPLALRRRLIQP